MLLNWSNQYFQLYGLNIWRWSLELLLLLPPPFFPFLGWYQILDWKYISVRDSYMFCNLKGMSCKTFWNLEPGWIVKTCSGCSDLMEVILEVDTHGVAFFQFSFFNSFLLSFVFFSQFYWCCVFSRSFPLWQVFQPNIQLVAYFWWREVQFWNMIAVKPFYWSPFLFFLQQLYLSSLYGPGSVLSSSILP